MTVCAWIRRNCAVSAENECVTEDGQLKHKATGKTVKAIVVVHVFGNMADMEAIMDIAQEFHLKVIEDATEALGTQYTKGRYAGKFAGTIGDFGAYSFNGNKIITTGGGGAVTAKDPTEVEHLKYLSTQAKDDPHFYIHNEVGYNYRMTNLSGRHLVWHRWRNFRNLSTVSRKIMGCINNCCRSFQVEHCFHFVRGLPRTSGFIL